MGSVKVVGVVAIRALDNVLDATAVAAGGGRKREARNKRARGTGLHWPGQRADDD